MVSKDEIGVLAESEDVELGMAFADLVIMNLNLI
jgi:hypothetical protein